MDRRTYKKIKKTSDEFGISESSVNQIITKICDKLMDQRKGLLKKFNKIIEKFHKILLKEFPGEDYLELDAFKEINNIHRNILDNKV